MPATKEQLDAIEEELRHHYQDGERDPANLAHDAELVARVRYDGLTVETLCKMLTDAVFELENARGPREAAKVDLAGRSPPQRLRIVMCTPGVVEPCICEIDYTVAEFQE